MTTNGKETHHARDVRGLDGNCVHLRTRNLDSECGEWYNEFTILESRPDTDGATFHILETIFTTNPSDNNTTLAPMAPMSSMKRSTPSQSDEGSPQEHINKKRRISDNLPVTPPPEIAETTSVHRVTTFEDDPHQLLQRSIGLALQHVGFDGAKTDALEAMCSQVDACQYCGLYPQL